MPDIGTVHYDVALTNVSLAYRNMQFIAREIAPEVAVRKQSDRYFIYDPGKTHLAGGGDLRAPGAPASEVDFQLSTGAYFCDGHALASSIPDEERENSDAPLRPEVDRVEYLTERILLGQEKALAAALRDATTGLPTEGSEGTPWDDPAFDVTTRIEAGRSAIMAGAQVAPNTLVLSQPVFTAIRNHPLVTERVKYTRLGTIGATELAQLFDVERVLVARAMHIAAPGDTAPTHVWGRDAFLLHVPARAGLKSIAAALTFVWGGAMGSVRGVSVDTWREERRKATSVRVQKYYDTKVTARAAGYWFADCLA
jgi:hypothetical protein